MSGVRSRQRSSNPRPHRKACRRREHTARFLPPDARCASVRLCHPHPAAKDPSMEADRFDTLTRTLATAGSRRRALVATLGGALGMFGLVHSDEAQAGGKCRPACDECQTCKQGRCRRTRHGKKCKNGTCHPVRDRTPCSGGGFCQSGTCDCPLGMQFCGTCVNPKTNRAHCGSCGVVCAAGKVCCNGTCAFPNGTENCCVAAGEICTPDGGFTFGSYVCCSKVCDNTPGLPGPCR
jgi:hypothetical protein